MPFHGHLWYGISEVVTRWEHRMVGWERVAFLAIVALAMVAGATTEYLSARGKGPQ